jgi:hypothetical protein
MGGLFSNLVVNAQLPERCHLNYMPFAKSKITIDNATYADKLLFRTCYTTTFTMQRISLVIFASILIIIAIMSSNILVALGLGAFFFLLEWGIEEITIYFADWYWEQTYNPNNSFPVIQ